MNDFCSDLGQKKVIKKEKVKLIHDEKLTKDLQFKKMNRDEIRSIQLYFQHYLNQKDIILSYLRANKKEIISEFLD